MSSNSQVNRRRFLKAGVAASVIPSAASRLALSNVDAWSVADPYRRLGVRAMINAVGTLTTLSGTLMPPEVSDAMREASRNFIPIHELQEKVGERLAELSGAEAAFVTAGASAGLCLAACAVTAGDDPARMRELPDLTGLKNQIIIQKRHRNGYDHAFRMVGARLVEVETADEMKQAINSQTAAVAFVMSHHTLGGKDEFEYKVDTSLGFEDRYVVGPYGRVSLEETVAIAHAAGLPVILDAAAEIPPAENLQKFVKMKVDLVAFSGGKNLRGPQCSGLLLGKRELIRKAYANSSPHNYFARIAKVGKEEIVGLLAAVEHYLQKDHRAERRKHFEVLRYMSGRLEEIPGVSTEFITNNDYSHTPRLAVHWDEQKSGIRLEDMIAKLREGDPPIVASDMRRFNPPWTGLGLFPYNLLPGEEDIIVSRIRGILA